MFGGEGTQQRQSRCRYVRLRADEYAFRTVASSSLPASLGTKGSIFRGCIEAWALLYPLLGFDDAVAVQVGAEVAVSANCAFRIDYKQLADEETQGLFLFGCAGIGCAAVGQKTTLVGDADAPGVEAPDVGADMV